MVLLAARSEQDFFCTQTSLMCTFNRMWIVRKFISEMNPIKAMNTLRDRLVQSRNNEEFLMSMNG